MLLGPFTSNGLITGFVGFVDVGNLGDKGVIGVGVAQQRTNGKEEFGDGQSGAPFVLQNIQTDATVGVNVGVVDLCGEVDLRGFEGVVRGEVDVQEEDTSLEWALLGAHDCGGPVKKVIPSGSSRARHRRVLLEVLQFFVDPSQGLLSHVVKRVVCVGGGKEVGGRG